jgi:hypothetical protein
MATLEPWVIGLVTSLSGGSTPNERTHVVVGILGGILRVVGGTVLSSAFLVYSTNATNPIVTQPDNSAVTIHLKTQMLTPSKRTQQDSSKPTVLLSAAMSPGIGQQADQGGSQHGQRAGFGHC